MKTLSCLFGLTLLPLSAEPPSKPIEPTRPLPVEGAKPVLTMDELTLKRIVEGTVSHLKELGLALFEFDTQYSSYPSNETAKTVKESTDTKLSLNTATSNDYFRQLLASGIATNEKIFQIGSPEKVADNVSNTDESALAKGECNFTYVLGSSSADHPTRPLVLGPLVPGQMKFDPVPLGGQAVILFVDNSVRTSPISPTGDVMINGKNVFDPTQPFWNGKKPEVIWPK